MRRRSFCALGLVITLSQAASASVLTFDITPINNYDLIPSNYGDRITSTVMVDGGFTFGYGMGNGFTPNVVVDYRTRDNTGLGAGGTISNYLEHWDTGYGDLVNVAYADQFNGVAEISLTPDSGYGIRLNSFDLASWPFTDRLDQPLVIFDENYNVLIDYGLITIPGAGGTHLTVVPNLVHFGTIHIQFANQWNSGIDNINFDQVTTQVIPEPSSIVLAGVGLAGMIAFKKRRRAA